MARILYDFQDCVWICQGGKLPRICEFNRSKQYTACNKSITAKGVLILMFTDGGGKHHDCWFVTKDFACYYRSMFFNFLFAKVFEVRRNKYLQLIIIGLDFAVERK